MLLNRREARRGDLAWQAHWRGWLPNIPALWCDHITDPEHPQYNPRPQCKHLMLDEPWEDIFDRLDPRIVNKILIGGGEGASKSLSISALAVCRITYDCLTVAPTPSLYWVIGADYQDAYKEWSYMKEMFEATDSLDREYGTNGSVVRKQGRDECVMKLKAGPLIATVSGKDPEKIARENLDGIIGAEISRWTEEVKRRAYLRTARKANAWIIGGGSFNESDGWYASEFDLGEGPNEIRLYCTSVGTWENTHLYPHGEQTPSLIEQKLSMSAQRYSERIKGRPEKPAHAVMHGFSNSLHVNPDLEILPDVPVELAIDPGNKVYYIGFIQRVDGEIRLLDEIYSSHIDAHSPQELVQMTFSMDSGVSRYIGQDGHVIDFAGRQQHFRHKSPKAEWKMYSRLDLNDLGKTYEKEDIINRLRSLMNTNPRTDRPFIQVHPRCRGFLAEAGIGRHPLADLGGGPWMRSKKSDGTIGEPREDNNHACTAIGFYAEYHFASIFQIARRNKRPGPRTYESGGFGSTAPVLDYQAFPNTKVRRSDGSTVTYPGKRISQLGGGGRVMRRGY